MIFSEFISPATVRSALKRKAGDKYRSRKDAEIQSEHRAKIRRLSEDDLAVRTVFA